METEREIITRLEKRLFILEKKLERQDMKILDLEGKNKSLFKENVDLKDRLGLNSSNSSIPSSKEFYKIQKQSKKPTGRRRGGQVGHNEMTPIY